MNDTTHTSTLRIRNYRSQAFSYMPVTSHTGPHLTGCPEFLRYAVRLRLCMRIL